MKLNLFNFYIKHYTFSTPLNLRDQASKYVLSSAYHSKSPRFAPVYKTLPSISFASWISKTCESLCDATELVPSHRNVADPKSEGPLWVENVTTFCTFHGRPPVKGAVVVSRAFHGRFRCKASAFLFLHGLYRLYRNRFV